MNLSQQIKLGFKSYSLAWRFIKENKLRKYFLFPLLLNILFFSGGFTLVEWISEQLVSEVLHFLHISDPIEGWLGYIYVFFEFLIKIIVRILQYLIMAYVGGYLILIALSPILALLSEKTASIISGQKTDFNLPQFIKDITRGVAIALRNLFIELAFIIIMLFTGFIPVIGWLIPFVMFLISAYFYGFSFIDYSSERKQLTISQSVQYVRNNKGVAIANGTIYATFMMLPFIGVTLAGFCALVSVVAATISVQKIDKNSS